MHNETLVSSLSPDRAAAWRVFIECAFALIDILETEMEQECGISLSEYDVLVHLDQTSAGLPMSELATAILRSRSGLTRVIDRMEKAGLVQRTRPPADRRVIAVVLTPTGAELLQRSRAMHRRGILEHFARHIDDDEVAALDQALRKVRSHVRSSQGPAHPNEP